jgi:ribonuclease P protein component
MINGISTVRMGISIGKRVGNAVTRNRVKRMIREVFRTGIKPYEGGFDIIFMPFQDAANAGYQEFKQEIERFFIFAKNKDLLAKKLILI